MWLKPLNDYIYTNQNTTFHIEKHLQALLKTYIFAFANVKKE